MQLSRLGSLSGLIGVALVLVAALSWRELASDPASAAGEAMAVDCDASTAGIDPSCTYDSGETFDIAVHVTNAGGGYIAYQTKVRWTDAVLNYLPAAASTENLWPITTPPAAPEPCSAVHTDNQPGDPSVLFTCFQFSFPGTTSTFTGPILRLQMQCQGAGPSPVALRSNAEENPQAGTVLVDGTGTEVNPALTPADVTCLEPPTCADMDGDTICDDADPDIDGDGCLNAAEQQTAIGSEETGGRRDPLNPYDFYDVDGDKVIDSFNDFFSVAFAFGDDADDVGTDEPDGYDAALDRSAPLPGGDVWDMQGPDGVIDLFNDIFGVGFQFGHDCS